MLTFLLLVACETSKIPAESAHYTVTAAADPEEGTYSDTFEYYLSFDASSALIYIGEDAFARGTVSGCDVTYQSVVVGQDTDGGNVKWQLNGQASIESADGDPCVDGEDDWAGTEWFEIVASEDEAIPVGQTYDLLTNGSFVGFTE
ncbi:hypothetical protein LBMAG42_12720 [Deltaproteobacteria bacterium]|nr:hypothetical protein LBMAG42_12720 [Deltaproteobacteria bacterium]